MHFSGFKDDFASIEEGNFGTVSTANGVVPLKAKGKILIEHEMFNRKKGVFKQITSIEAFWFPQLDVRLMLLGQLLLTNLNVIGTSEHLRFYAPASIDGLYKFIAKPHIPGTSIFWVEARSVTVQQASAVIATKADFEIWHKQLGHPSNDTLQQIKNYLEKIPTELEIP